MPAGTAGSWGAVAFHRQVVEIRTLRVQRRQQYTSGLADIFDGLSAQLTVRELKELVSTRYHYSPRQQVTLRSWGAVLDDRSTLHDAKLSDGGVVELTVSPRTPEECRLLVQQNPPTQLRVRPHVSSHDELLTLTGLRADTTIGSLKGRIWDEKLLVSASKEALEKSRLLFHPAFLTWEVLLSPSSLDDRMTIIECGLMRNDILYLAPEKKDEVHHVGKPAGKGGGKVKSKPKAK
ncbi:hypothetical protein T492DRAFT_955230 [Pavlovales sp. CCMP2436]|nr:hypothetical protein T492DRAFT_955230 [Pavlovales sp. CCMP2436]